MSLSTQTFDASTIFDDLDGLKVSDATNFIPECAHRLDNQADQTDNCPSHRWKFRLNAICLLGYRLLSHSAD